MSPAPNPPPAGWPALPPLPDGDVIVFAPEPAPWLRPILQQLGPRALVWAPWARSTSPRRSWPAAVGRALARRTLPDQPGLRRVPGFDLADVALGRLGADRPALQYPLAHHRRIALGHLVAPWLTRSRAAAVIAPCFAATPVFAAARDLGAVTVLIQDWPDLAALHADLDAAAGRHPDDPWLQRFRPPARWIAEQRSERHLADSIAVRGRFAARRIVADGVPPCRIVRPAIPCPAPVPGGPRSRVLLAGRGTARAGAHEALDLLDRMPDLRLTGALGTAALPALRRHPRFTATDDVRWSQIRAVLAPAWVEAYPMAVGIAAARAVPIIATDRAAGALPADRYRRVEPGDVTGARAALG